MVYAADSAYGVKQPVMVSHVVGDHSMIQVECVFCMLLGMTPLNAI